MNIYLIVLLITAVLALVFRRQKKAFIISASAVHIFVCGFRYKFMHGDLMKYNTEFLESLQHSWLAPETLRGGRNTLFYMLMKFIAEFFNRDFQVLLFFISCISILAIALVIYNYSPKPFVSFAMWSCFGFYMFTFSSIKQTLAMALVMFAANALLKNNRRTFYIFTILAGFTHFPAFIFLPAFELCQVKKPQTLVLFYSLTFMAIFLFRNQIVTAMTDVYYETEEFADVAIGQVGGKTIMMLAILGAGYLLCDLQEDRSRIALILVSVASLLQLFSVYDNVFTRLSDYYFQFMILLAPLMLEQVHGEHHYPALYFAKDSRKIMTAAFLCLAVVFYYTTCFTGTDIPSPDNLVANFAFMWQVR